MVTELFFVAIATALNSNGLQFGVRILKKQSLHVIVSVPEFLGIYLGRQDNRSYKLIIDDSG